MKTPSTLDKNGAHHIDLLIVALLAQWLERPTENRQVVGSTPTGGTLISYGGIAQLVRASVSYAECPWFESRCRHSRSGEVWYLAGLITQRTSKNGSNPTSATSVGLLTCKRTSGILESLEWLGTIIPAQCGISLVVKPLSSKQTTRVRFPHTALRCGPWRS
jgi:hypothetical protein